MNIWEQQQDESAAQYKAFQAYLRERSIEAAYREYSKNAKPKKAEKSPAKRKKQASGKASGSFKMWSKAFRWEERAKGYDAHITNETIRTTVDVNKEAYKQRMTAYTSVASKGIKKIFDLLDNATKLSEVMPVVEYFDRMTLAAMEREQLAELQAMTFQKSA